MSDDTLITKRLHISGLTPSITPSDLSQKLGSFGTVTALDGFGALDALGRPRKFGYVTIETTKTKLARCMNLLSGVTWKGAQLRLGEAKPDFRERLEAERKAMEEGEPPRKKRKLPRGVQGVHASDMSLVTPENVEERGGWKVTPLGRIVKPIRMRPEHPLPPPLVSNVSSSTKLKKGEKEKKGEKDKKDKKKKRVKEPPVRARRRTIDPTKWGSTQLKGVFLENAGGGIGLVEERYSKPLVVDVEVESSEDENSEEGEEEEVPQDDGLKRSEPEVASRDDEEPAARTKITAPLIEEVQKQALPVPIPPPPSTRTSGNAVASELLEEKTAALGLLQSLFGGRDDDDWVGRESVDSDIEMDEQKGISNSALVSAGAVDQEIEEVPMSVDAPVSIRESSQEKEEPVASQAQPEEDSETQKTATQKTKLKDLFAPQEESTGFSLLGHLDLDLELDDDTLDATFTAAPQTAHEHITERAQTPIHVIPDGTSHTRFTLDPSLPLFFPLSKEARVSGKGRVRDTLDVAREKGWDWRGFCRTQTTEEIKQRWEAQKVELTKDWKRRHREAIKSRRRRGGGDGE